MKIYTIVGGVNGAGKSGFTGVLKGRTTDLAAYRNGEPILEGEYRSKWIAELAEYRRTEG